MSLRDACWDLTGNYCVMSAAAISSGLRQCDSKGDRDVRYLRYPGRDISFPIFTRKEIETKRIRKEIKTIISRLNHFLSFLSNI